MLLRQSTALRTIVGNAVLLGLLTACGDGSGTGTSGETKVDSGENNLGAPKLNIASSVKQMHFSWNAVSDATSYTIYQNADGVSGFTPLDGDVPGTFHDSDIAVHRLNWSAARYILEACNVGGCSTSNEVNVGNSGLSAIGYFKASNTAGNDLFARATALSGDGNTLAVGALGKDNSAGAVYIYTRKGGTWSQLAYIQASDASSGDYFGNSIALSSDGKTLAVGAYLEDSLGTGINGSQGSIAENSSNRGAVYVFTRSGDTWPEQAYLKAGSSRDNAYFGGAVTLNSDGNTLAVGAIGERTGGMDAGAVYVFTRNAGAWSQQALVKPSTIFQGAHFGTSVTLNLDGNTLAVGAPDEYNGSNVGGTVYVFTRDASAWSQQAAVKASNTTAFDAFGFAIALSGDGNRLAVGAQNEKSAAVGIDGNQADQSANAAGAVYIFTRSENLWPQQAYVKASNAVANMAFGGSLAFSKDGKTLAVGASGEASAATGIGGNQADTSSSNAGAVYIFTHNERAWSQQNYVKASNTDADDLFGFAVALSGEGNTLAVGAFSEDSAAINIGGDQADNSAANAGAVYLY